MDELIADSLCVRRIEVQEALSFVEGRSHDEIAWGDVTVARIRINVKAQMATDSIGTNACIQRG